MARYLSTPELLKGDIVLTHGMRCLIDRPLTLSKSHADGRTFYVQALVLNRDEVPDAIVPRGWTADWKRDGRHAERPHNGQHRWTIQGNDRATWTVERTT